mmetsp:Transcript_22803/g.70677  ORF Transcript_22803/g.70677 Transcript_22803/m.70677 type:complete len:374 (+) Transcript_22803:346-1467(+)
MHAPSQPPSVVSHVGGAGGPVGVGLGDGIDTRTTSDDVLSTAMVSVLFASVAYSADVSSSHVLSVDACVSAADNASAESCVVGAGVVEPPVPLEPPVSVAVARLTTVKLTMSDPRRMSVMTTSVKSTPSARAMSRRTAAARSARRVALFSKAPKLLPRMRTEATISRGAAGVGAGVVVGCEVVVGEDVVVVAGASVAVVAVAVVVGGAVGGTDVVATPAAAVVVVVAAAAVALLEAAVLVATAKAVVVGTTFVVVDAAPVEDAAAVELVGEPPAAVVVGGGAGAPVVVVVVAACVVVVVVVLGAGVVVVVVVGAGVVVVVVAGACVVVVVVEGVGGADVYGATDGIGVGVGVPDCTWHAAGVPLDCGYGSWPP